MTQSSPCLWSQLPQSSRAPCDRYKHACCSLDGHVYVLGGRHSRCLSDFWRYNVVRNEWAELSCSGEAAPAALEEHSMVAHQGFLYVFGGLRDSAYTAWTCPLWVFDTAKQKWVNCRGKRSCLQAQSPTNRKGHSAVVLGASMLLYGGLIDMKGSSQEFWSLDFDTTAWSQLSGPQQGSVGPGPRHNHSAVAHQGNMFLFGGLKGLREQRDFWKWSSGTHTWTSLRNKSGPPRLMGHSAVVYRDSMLLFGGGESHTSPLNFLFRYSFSSQSWTQVGALPGSSPPDKIHHCCIGLGPSYSPAPGSYGPPGPEHGRSHPFKNRCCPAPPLSFLGSEGAIELETFSPEQSSTLRQRSDAPVQSCLTFENKSFRTQISTEGEEEEEDEDVSQHLPDLLLVLGGRPSTPHSPISTWQMTLLDS